MKKLVISLRKVHRHLTIPIVILMVLKFATGNTDYGLIVSKIVSIGMLFMALSGLLMYIQAMRMKVKKKKSNEKVVNF